ncbi:MAG: monooxygenase, partial [Pseudomonadota bacterium]|nr:monooxygenase [Pseudomonadota bacterium]
MALKADTIYLGATAVGFGEPTSHVALQLSDRPRIKADVLIGADGIKSAVRRQIVGPATPDYTGDAAWRLRVPVDR